MVDLRDFEPEQRLPRKDQREAVGELVAELEEAVVADLRDSLLLCELAQALHVRRTANGRPRRHRRLPGDSVPRHGGPRRPRLRQFVVDVGFADSISWTPDAIETSDLLSFAGIERVRVPALPLSQHVAEKVHAYTRRYGATGRESTRPKDLGRHPPDRGVGAARRRISARGLEATFEQRQQQPLPASLPAPPASWREPYCRLAEEVAIEPELDKAFAEAAAFLDPILAGRAAGEWDSQRRAWA